MKKFKLIRSHPADAESNMSLDKEIFTQYLKDSIPVLRLYSWKAPSFTYGVSQNPANEIDLAGCARDKIGLAKRMTGGGILFHHDEITYSFTCSKTDVGEPPEVFVSYRQISRFLIRFYESLGLAASFALQESSFKNKSAPSELCSASFEKYDIVIGGRKIGGNAQKRSRQAIFQHGCIPCSIDWNFVRRYVKSLPSDIAKSVTTLKEELKIIPARNILEQKLIESFESEFGAVFVQENQEIYETSVA